MVPSARLGKEGGTRNGARETAIYAPVRELKSAFGDLSGGVDFDGVDACDKT